MPKCGLIAISEINLNFLQAHFLKDIKEKIERTESLGETEGYCNLGEESTRNCPSRNVLMRM
jgi:hypothetical protein